MIEYAEDEKNDMVELIQEYNVEHDDCGRSYCDECCLLIDCYHVARQKEDSEWAKSLDYAGYANEEEFWEELLN